MCFSFSLPLARDFRKRHVRSSFSLRGVPTTQTDKSNPENGTGDAASSGKKSGSGTYCGKCVARGNPNSDNGLTPVTFEGLERKRETERGKGRERGEDIRAYTCSLLRVSGNLKRKTERRVDSTCEGQFSSGAVEGPTWVRKKGYRSCYRPNQKVTLYKYLRRPT